VQYSRAADWPRQTQFETVSGGNAAAWKALVYIMGKQRSTGLVLSWKEEPSPKAWLYDQALALMALTREGTWQSSGAPAGPAMAAAHLANFLISAQKSDGHWARAWNPNTGAELQDDGWMGDQAWCVMALEAYGQKSGSVAAQSAARRGGEWLAARVPPGGMAVDGTEGNVDVWWALAASGFWTAAERVKSYLLTAVWDPDLKYWWGGNGNPFIAMDAAGAWTSSFSRHPSVNQPQMALAAMTFAGKALAAQSDNGSLCGMDGVGPVSLWSESMGQYVAAGGQGSQAVLNTLMAEQNSDGSLPGSPNNWSTTFGWLSSWSGLSPTAWLYFAVTGPPFLNLPAYTASTAIQDPALAFDGDTATRWESQWTDPQWLDADYGAPRWIDRVTIRWENAYAKSYKVQTSLDGTAWTDVYTTVSGDGGVDVATFPVVQARHVRVYATERGTSWGYSIWEMTADRSVAAGAPAALLSSPDDAFQPGEIYSYPNPARGGKPAVFHVEVGRADNVELRVYDVAGQLVHQEAMAGDPSLINGGQGLRYAYETAWSTSGVPPGVYLYTVRAQKKGAADILHTSKMAVLK
jgi:hypothetical protein